MPSTSLYFHDELLERIDARRGHESRSSFVSRAVQQAMGDYAVYVPSGTAVSPMTLTNADFLIHGDVVIKDRYGNTPRKATPVDFDRLNRVLDDRV